MFCQSKELFGKPREGAHRHRIPFIDLALVDVVMTFVLGTVLWLATKRQWQGFACIMVFLLLLSIIAHRLFCVRTKIDQCLFPSFVGW